MNDNIIRANNFIEVENTDDIVSALRYIIDL